ncbi:MAG: lysophospholipid acyltransferase family protein [Isosphaeraceae bacterium]
MSAVRTPSGGETPGSPSKPAVTHDRARHLRIWYELIRCLGLLWFSCCGGLRATGREHIPRSGGALLISNHASYLDVFVLGIPVPRTLNYVARSTLFLPILRTLIYSVGGFPIQREGMGASGLKETLRRLRNGGMVLLFPEGTRCRDGRLGELKPGIAVLAERARVPIVPAAVAGTFEAWPRSQLLPSTHAIRIHYGPPIPPEEIAGLPAESITALLHDRLALCHAEALRALARDLQIEPDRPRTGS